MCVYPVDTDWKYVFVVLDITIHSAAKETVPGPRGDKNDKSEKNQRWTSLSLSPRPAFLAVINFYRATPPRCAPGVCVRVVNYNTTQNSHEPFFYFFIFLGYKPKKHKMKNAES